MPTRATIHLSILPGALLKRLPSRYRECVVANLLGEIPVDLVMFETGSSHVVSSKDLNKALRTRGESQRRLVAVGYDFTQEARAAIDSLGGLVFAESSHFGWTDERWYATHQG